MESHTTQFRGSFASPPTEHLEGFPPAVYDTSDDLQLGTKANPIVIDETSPPDSIPDVIATYIDGDHGFDDTGHLCSDAETEIIASPAFWDAFLDENFSHGDEVHIASLSASAQSNPTRSHSEAIQDVGIPTVAQVDDPVQGAPESSSYESDHCSGWVDGKHEKGAEHQIAQVSQEDPPQEPKDPTPACGNTASSATGFETTQEAKPASCNQPWRKRKLSHDEGMLASLRRSERLIKRARSC